MNHRLLNRIKALVRREPDKMDMHTWAQKHPCGTAGCIGWHAARLSGYQSHFSHDGSLEWVRKPGDCEVWSIFEVARDVMGLTNSQAGDLFSTGGWPHVEWVKYNKGDKLSVVRMIERIQSEDPAWKKKHRNAGKLRKKKTSKAVC